MKNRIEDIRKISERADIYYKELEIDNGLDGGRSDELLNLIQNSIDSIRTDEPFKEGIFTIKTPLKDGDEAGE